MPWLGARSSKAPETFRARKANFSSPVSENGEVYTPEASCMKGTSVHIKNMWIKQLCNRKVPDFAMALRARKVSGALEKKAPGMALSLAWKCVGNCNLDHRFSLLTSNMGHFHRPVPWRETFHKKINCTRMDMNVQMKSRAFAWVTRLDTGQPGNGLLEFLKVLNWRDQTA